MSNIAKSFEKLIDSTFVSIDGILVQRGTHKATGADGYIWGNHWYGNIDDLKAAMKYAANAIQVSIVNPNGEEVPLPKFYTDKYKQGKGAYNEYKKDQE